MIKFWLVGAETCASAAASANPCVFDAQIRKVRFAAEERMLELSGKITYGEHLHEVVVCASEAERQAGEVVDVFSRICGSSPSAFVETNHRHKSCI